MVSFDVTKTESAAVDEIVERAALYWLRHRNEKLNRGELGMDLCATHANGNPLDFDGLLKAKALDFVHDIAGIMQHIDRSTGKLGDCFIPRYSKRA